MSIAAIRFVACLIFLCAVAPTAQAQDPKMAAAFDLYAKGRALDAISALRAHVDETSDEQTKLQIWSLMMDFCSAAYSYQCLLQDGTKFIELSLKLHRPTDPPALQAFQVAILQHSMAGDLDWIEKQLGFDFADKLAASDRDPLRTADLFLLAANIQRSRGDYKAAAASISKALAVTMTFDRRGSYIAAYDLSRLLILASINSASVRALSWMSRADNFIQQQLTLAGPDRAFYLADQTRALMILGPTPAYLDVLHEAERVASNLQADPTIKELLLDPLYAREAMTQALLGHRENSRIALAKHPVGMRRAELLAQGHFGTVLELGYAAIEIFSAVWFGDEPDQAWLPLLEQPVSSPIKVAGLPELYSAFQSFSKGLLLLKRANHSVEGERLRKEAAAEIRLAARTRLAMFEREFSATDDAFPLPDVIDRILLGVTSALPIESDGDRDLLIQSMEYLNRSPRYALVDTLGAMAAAPDTQARELVHSQMRLSDQQAQWERSALGAFIDGFRPNAGNMDAKEQATRNISIMKTMANFIHDREEVSKKVDLFKASELRSRLPTFTELKAVLRPGEAFVGYVPSLLGDSIRVCVADGRMWTSGLHADQTKLTDDVRELRQTLTADPRLDETNNADYPVDTAVRLYHLLFDDLGDCLKRGHHLIFAPPEVFQGFPIAALLAEAPTRGSNGYDFGSAHWFFVDHPISYVLSAKAFIAARTISRATRAELRFLGVGDPHLHVLARASGESTQSATERTPTPFAKALHRLSELPDTAEELKAIGTIFGASHTDLLLGSEATQRRLFSYDLARYDSIEFATHGLLRDDLPGLDQAALVLTPSPNDDSENSGLLTAEEVAALSLRARLLVLSACNTANFDEAGFGQQVQGLTSAFAVAGVPTTVATLWSIESGTSRRMMIALYSRLKSKDFPTVALALRDAQRSVLQNAPATALRHPRFWAPFVVFGDGGTTLSTNPSQRVH